MDRGCEYDSGCPAFLHRPNTNTAYMQRAQTQEQTPTTNFVESELDAEPGKIAELKATKVEVRQVEESVRPLGACPANLHRVANSHC